MNDGAAFKALMTTIRRDVALYGVNTFMSSYAQRLELSLRQVEIATQAMQSAPDEGTYTANATYYLDMLGHVIIAWMWLRQGGTASGALSAGAKGTDKNFYTGKLDACHYFFDFELTRLQHWLPILTSANPLFSNVDTTCF